MLVADIKNFINLFENPLDFVKAVCAIFSDSRQDSLPMPFFTLSLFLLEDPSNIEPNSCERETQYLVPRRFSLVLL
jgi:hypothetical protein